MPFNPYSRNGITNKDRFFNVTVQITAPDGTTTTQGPFFGDSNGNLWFNYTPKDVGNYTLKAIYPGGQLSPGQFLPSESQTTILVVQQDPIQYYSDNPLPTDYWTRPIDGQNRLWSSISGDWLMASYSLQYKTAAGVSVGAYNPYSQAPQAPHIMWTKEITTGGLVGGDQGANSYYSGPSYSSLFSPPIIMSGKLYYNTPEGFVCVELRTGQQLWETKDGKRLVCGQEWDTQKYSYTTAGIRSYLWTTSWEGIDPFNGQQMFNFTDTPSSLGRPFFSDDGSILAHIIGRGWIAMWNSSMIRPSSGTYNWTRGLQWNVTVPLIAIPPSLFPVLGISSSPAPSILGINDNVLMTQVATNYYTVLQAGYDMTTGQQLWVLNYTQNILNLKSPYPTYWPAIGDGVLAQFVMQTRSWYGYDVKTGTLLWESDQQDYPWGTYTSYYPTIAEGILYSLSYDGNIYAFNTTTGKQIWKFNSGSSGAETSSGTYPFFYGPIIADGVVFAGVAFETPSHPLPRGAKVFAVNATTGTKIWDMNGMIYLRAIADGYLLGVNVYDARLYCIGKGPSKTTVTAPQPIISEGSQILLTGTVTDISAGTKQDQVASNYPNGLPAISDDSQGQFMAAVYMQQPRPTDLTGVEISLDVLDVNGNYRNIGTTTSDINGFFSFEWTPDIEGKYTVIATFQGSESYWPSHAETAFVVEAAAPTPTPQPTLALPPTEMYVLGIGVAIIIAIAIVGALILMAVRKRP